MMKEKNKPVVLKSKEEFLKLIYLINKHFGSEQAKQLEVNLRLKQKLPSSNFKTKKDFLEQLKLALLKSPPQNIKIRTTPRMKTSATTPVKQKSSTRPQSSKQSKSLKPSRIKISGHLNPEEEMVELKKQKLKELIRIENLMSDLKKQKLEELIEIENHKLWIFSLQPGEKRVIFKQK